MRIKYNIPEDKWNDWKWQLSNSVTTSKQLKELLGDKAPDVSECIKHFPMRITPYYLSLIDWDNPNDPIRLQSVPSKLELEDDRWAGEDPLSEQSMSPVNTIVHRYPDRVLFTVSNVCAMYCRHCTRKRLAGRVDLPFSNDDLEKGIQYIREHKEVRDVVVSGGDPLLLPDDRILWILNELQEIPHIQMVRIGTRVLVTMPMRITNQLVSGLSSIDKLWINTHFNHSNELTEASITACRKLQKVGIPINNQSVLLKGVNDDLDTMKNLLYDLTANRIRPYYLYQCDLVRGTKHFRTDVLFGIKLMGQLRGNIGGLCVPQYVIDAPQGGGKVPMNPMYVFETDPQYIRFYNYQGNEYMYPRG